jgi:hypothetical protein
LGITLQTRRKLDNILEVKTKQNKPANHEYYTQLNNEGEINTLKTNKNEENPHHQAGPIGNASGDPILEAKGW